MIARLRATWLSINASYWFYPAVFALAAALLASITIWIDRNWAAETLSQLDIFAPSRPQGARSLLSLIAGSMIGVAATVFSITIAAVAYASGTYGPRLLTNFMENRGNQLSLATFIATFVYSLLVLRVVRGEQESGVASDAAVLSSAPGFVPQLSVLVAFGLTLLSIAVLVFLLNHIPSSIRINHVIEGIGRRLVSDIRKRFPDKGDAEPTKTTAKGVEVRAQRAGYVRIVEFESLDDFAEKHEGRVFLLRRTGEFVHEAVPMLVWDGPELDDEMAGDLRGCFAIGSSRSPEQDLDYLIDELVEIALRALSPGINDPFTANTALDWLGAGTADLAMRDLDCGPAGEDSDPARVLSVADDFDHFLERGFGAVVATVATSDVAATKFFGVIAGMLPAAANRARRDAMIAILDRMIDHARLALDKPAMMRIDKLREDFDSR